MKIYGSGTFTAPGCSRVVWDFEDGPFDTVNPGMIEEAKRRGYSFSPPAIKPEAEPEIAESNALESSDNPAPEPVNEKERRGRKPKEKPSAEGIAEENSVGNGEVQQEDAESEKPAEKKEGE